MIVVDRGAIIDFSFNYLCLFRRVISMVGKNNKHVQLRQEADKQTRFSLKKLTVGVASIAVGATLLLGQPISVNAEEPSTTQADQSLGEYKEAAKKDLADKKIENEHLNSLIDSAESKEAVDKLVANYTQPEIAAEDTDDIKNLKLYKAAKIAKLKAKDFDNATFIKKLEDAETKEGFDTLFAELEAEVDKKAEDAATDEPVDETTDQAKTEESAPTQSAESTETEATEEPKVADKATESSPDEVTSETEEDDDYAEAVRELNDLNLSDTIKEDFAQKIKAAEDNKEAVSQILTEAIDLAELNTKKDAALVEIDQTNLHVDDSNELKGRIEVATSAEEVDNVLTDAGKRAEEQANQAQTGEATTEAKPEAKPEDKKPAPEKKTEEKKPEAGQKPEAKKPEEKKPENKKPEVKKPEEKKPEAKKPDASKQPEKGKEAQPQKPEQKPDQQKQQDQSADKAAQDKKEQELKMAAAKDEAKKEINNLANLSDKQKGELLAGIDKADTPAKIGEILDFARKLNQDQAPKQQKKQGERLPDTATGTWALGLIGATAILAGFGIKKFKK
ncbi:YSIRK-type signal peptide-containing protein [Dolosigranulum pigrum]|nr:YSIRK-type signal peptide-containing protein [Dolosigranulum pigrum]